MLNENMTVLNIRDELYNWTDELPVVLSTHSGRLFNIGRIHLVSSTDDDGMLVLVIQMGKKV